MASTTSTTGALVKLPAGQTLIIKAAGEGYVDYVDGVPGSGYTSRRVTSDRNEQIGPFADPATFRVRSATGAAIQYYRAPLKNGLIIIGDSIAAQNTGKIRVTLVDNGNGTATVSAADLRLYEGDVFTVEGSTVPIQNQTRAKVLSKVMTGTNVTSVTYALDGPYMPIPQTGGFINVCIDRHEADVGAVMHLKAISGAGFKVLGNYAAGGSSSEDVLVNIDSFLKNDAVAAWVQLGTNNVYARQFATPFSTASLKKVVDRIVSKGKIPIVSAIPPRSDIADSQGAGLNTPLQAERVMQNNAFLESYLPTVGGKFVNGWGKTSNGVTFASQDTNLAFANVGMHADGVHPSRLGARANAKGGVQAIRDIFPASNTRNPDPTYAQPNCARYFANTTLQEVVAGVSAGTATAGTGTLAADPKIAAGVGITNVVGTQTIAVSLVPGETTFEDGAAWNWQRIVITNMPAGGNVLARIQLGAPAGWTYGQVLEAFARVRVTSAATPGSGAPFGLTQPHLRLTCSTTLTGQDSAWACGNLSIGDPINEPMLLDLNTTPFAFKSQGSAVHGTVVFFRLDVEIYGRAAGASGTVDICWPDFLGPELP